MLVNSKYFTTFAVKLKKEEITNNKNNKNYVLDT